MLEDAAGRAWVHRLRALRAEDVSLGLIERRGGEAELRLPPILVVHGSALGAALFDLPVAGYSMLRALARAGRAAYAVDIRGYGLSLNGRVMDAPPEDNPPFATSEDAILDIGVAVDFIQKREDATTIDVVGSSWGTITASLYATRYPRNVRRLVLYAPLYADRHEAWLDRIADPEDRRRLHPKFGAHRLLTLDELIQRWNGDLGDAALEHRREPDMPQAIFSALSAADPRTQSHRPPALRIPNGALLDLVSVFNEQPLYEPAKLTMPTLIVRGADDTTSADRDARSLLSGIRSADKEYSIVSPGSHFLCVERNRRQLYERIGNFLQEGAVRR